MKKHRILSGLLALVLVFGLSACGGEDTTSPEPTDDIPESVEPSSSSGRSSTSSSSSSGRSSSSSSSSSGRSSTSSSGSSGSDYSFEDYLRDNDPDSYEFYQDIKEGWNSGTWDSENGFAGGND